MFSKRDRIKCVKHLPLLQIIGKRHPATRIVLLKHLDQPSLAAVVHAIRVVYSGVAEGDKCYPPKVASMLRSMATSNRRAFKAILQTKAVKVGKPQQKALFRIGGSVIGAILSVVVPYVIGQLLKKK